MIAAALVACALNAAMPCLAVDQCWTAKEPEIWSLDWTPPTRPLTSLVVKITAVNGSWFAYDWEAQTTGMDVGIKMVGSNDRDVIKSDDIAQSILNGNLIPCGALVS